MARKALGPATLQVVQAVTAVTTGPMLVACSGGPDSLALSAGAAIVARRRGDAVRAVVVDHGLQAGSDAVASGVVAQLRERVEMAAEVVRVQVAAAHRGPEAAAREARYAALAGARRPDEVVLLGHTLDDQAESVLLGLARGSGLRSLAGMAAVRGDFVRPLLGQRREVTAACCVELGLEPWIDPHNGDDRFARVRVRTRVLPVLEAELGPGVAEALARTAALARADTDLLDELASVHTDATSGDGLSCTRLAELDPALRSRVLRSWLLGQGARDVGASRLAAVAGLITDWHGQRWVDVPGVRVRRAGDHLQAVGRPRPRDEVG
jgi:tRNA(Ile)-lysidine synthase